MKKGSAFIMVSITLLFAAFTLGVLVGKNIRTGDVVITQHTEPSTVNAPTQPAATVPLPSAAVQTTAPTEETLPPVAGKVNLNTATLEQLITLPGIGPSLAQRILEHRNTYGPFSKLEELYDIPGIGEKKLAAIADLVTLED